MKPPRKTFISTLLTILALTANTVTVQWARADSFEYGGWMNDCHAQHTATVLPNGQLLIAGGGGFDGSDAELYVNDPVVESPLDGTWTYTGSMNEARYGHTATLLTNGLVLVTGGWDNPNEWDDGYGTALSSAELYDPSSGTWSYTGGMNAARAGHTATLLPNGKVLVTGGDDGSGNALATAELYDPSTGNWSYANPMHNAREYHTATLLPNGQVLVAGGNDGGLSDNNLPNAELYDPNTGNWTDTGSMNDGRGYHTATLLPNGQVLVTGGLSAGGISSVITVQYANLASAELYDPIAGTWSRTHSMNVARSAHTAALLPNGLVLVAGGLNDVDSSGIASAELYDPTTGNWTTTASLDLGAGQSTATLMPYGDVYIVGGDDLSYPDDSMPNSYESLQIYEFTNTTGTWKPTDWMDVARGGFQTATLLTNGQVLVAGGTFDNGYSDNSTPYCMSNAALYNPVTGMWADTNPMHYPRAFATATLLTNGLVLVAGGYSDDVNTPILSYTNAELYNPATGTWSDTGSMHVGRAGHTATLLKNGQVLVTGGQNIYGDGQSWYILSSAELYDPGTGTWSYTDSMHDTRFAPTATLLNNGKVLVAGGLDNSDTAIASAELYDPATGAWSYTDSMHDARVYHAAVSFLDDYTQSSSIRTNGMVLVAGGLNADGRNGGTPLASAELYHPATGTWTYTGSMNQARAFHTLTYHLTWGAPVAEALAVGGSTDLYDGTASVEVYSPYYGTWTYTGSMDVGREFHTATLLPDNRVLVTGGCDGNGSPLSGAELYNNGPWY